MCGIRGKYRMKLLFTADKCRRSYDDLYHKHSSPDGLRAHE